MRQLLGAIATFVLIVPASAARAASAVGRDSAPAAAQPSVLGAAVNPSNDHQYVFWRGPRGEIYEAWYNGSWHGPSDLGWTSASAPTAAVTAAGHQYVFWEGVNRHIYEARYVGAWKGPQDLTKIYGWGEVGESSSVVGAAVNPSSDDQYLFWRGLDGRISTAWYSGGWHGPVRTGWSAVSAPTVAVTAAGHQYVFWEDASGHVDEAWNDGAWQGPRDLTRWYGWGAAVGSPSVVAAAVNPSNDHQYVFWRGPRGRIYEGWYNAGWHGPSNLGWSSTSSPAVAVSSAAHQYVFWEAADGHIYEAWYVVGWSAPADRWTLSMGAGPYVEVLQTTANLAQRLALSHAQFGASAAPRGVPVIDVDDSVRYQRIAGVGGAMTDSSAWLIQDELSPAARASVMNELFGSSGIHLTFTLVPMGASDFTRNGRPYTYDDLPAGQSDPQLAHFSIAHDEQYIIPALRQMLAVNPQAQIFAVPWSPPAWMKANHALDDLGLRGTLLASAYEPLANYFVKFIEAYAADGLVVSAIAPENEPDAGSAFPAMSFPETDEASWIAQDLKPALVAANLNPRIYGGDTGWGSTAYAMALISSEARSAISGVAWHCYSGIPSVMNVLHAAAPSMDQQVAECAPNLSRYPVPEIVISAMRNWASAVTLWNLALDPSGGPVQPPNSGCRGCIGLVTIDERSRTVSVGRDYYQLGQVSTFLQNGAWRIGSNNFVTYYQHSATDYGVTAGLDDVAFLNPDGSRVLIAYNNSTAVIRFAVTWSGHTFTYALASGATVSFRWDPAS